MMLQKATRQGGSLFPCCAAARNLHHAGAPAPRAARLAPAQPWGSSLIQRGGSSPCSTGVAAAAGRQPDDSQCDSEGEDPEAFSPLPPQAPQVSVLATRTTLCMVPSGTAAPEEGACLECTLTYNHSNLDDEVAKQWLAALQACLEDPATML